MKEEINHPKRYGGDTLYECIKVLKAWLTQTAQELKKAKWCIEKLIEEVYLDEKEDNQDTIHS